MGREKDVVKKKALEKEREEIDLYAVIKKWLKNERLEARAEGRTEERFKTVISLVKSGWLKLEDAAEFLNLSIETTYWLVYQKISNLKSECRYWKTQGQERDEIDMCTAMKEWLMEERSEGRAEGRAEGRFETVVLLAKSGLLNLEEAVTPNLYRKLGVFFGRNTNFFGKCFQEGIVVIKSAHCAHFNDWMAFG